MIDACIFKYGKRGLILPDTATLPDLAEILSTSVDAILAGGDCPQRFQRRMRVERVREAIGCIQRLRDILGREHFMYRTMTDALDARMNSSIELAFQREGAMTLTSARRCWNVSNRATMWTVMTCVAASAIRLLPRPFWQSWTRWA